MSEIRTFPGRGPFHFICVPGLVPELCRYRTQKGFWAVRHQAWDADEVERATSWEGADLTHGRLLRSH